MKGLQEKNDDGIFLVVKHGGIVQESKHPREGFTPIEVVNARSGESVTKYVKRYKGVEAIVKKIEWYDREFEDTRFMGWKLVLDAAGVPCTLDLPFESRVGSRFMKLAENIDFAQPVEFSAWRGPDDKTAFSVKQNNENVPQKYTREDPGECPPPVQGFNKKWNFDAQKEFLHERMINVVIPRVQAIHASNGYHDATTDAPSENGNSDNGGGAGDKEVVLKNIQGYLKDYAAQKEIGVTDAIQKWFDTRAWPQVERLDLATLKTKERELADEVIPF